MKLDPTRRAEIEAFTTGWVCENKDLLARLAKPDPVRMSEELWYIVHAQGGKRNTALLEDFIEAAKTDPALFDALCFAGSARLGPSGAADAMPTAMRWFLSDVLSGRRVRPRKHGRKTPSLGRDELIYTLLLDLKIKFKLSPTRHETTDHQDSACDFAAAALRRASLAPNSYGRLKNIWLLHWKDTKRVFSGSPEREAWVRKSLGISYP